MAACSREHASTPVRSHTLLDDPESGGGLETSLARLLNHHADPVPMPFGFETALLKSGLLSHRRDHSSGTAQSPA